MCLSKNHSREERNTVEAIDIKREMEKEASLKLKAPSIARQDPVNSFRAAAPEVIEAAAVNHRRQQWQTVEQPRFRHVSVGSSPLRVALGELIRWRQVTATAMGAQ